MYHNSKSYVVNNVELDKNIRYIILGGLANSIEVKQIRTNNVLKYTKSPILILIRNKRFLSNIMQMFYLEG